MADHDSTATATATATATPTAPQKKLMDLPSELVEKVLVTLIDTTGPLNAWEARGACRFFRDIISHQLSEKKSIEEYLTRTLDCYGGGSINKGTLKAMFPTFLKARLRDQNPSSAPADHYLVRINNWVDKLFTIVQPANPGLERQEALGNIAIYLAMNQGVETFLRWCGKFRKWTSLHMPNTDLYDNPPGGDLAIAAATGYVPAIQHFLDNGGRDLLQQGILWDRYSSPFPESPYFTGVFIAAVCSGKVEGLNLLLQDTLSWPWNQDPNSGPKDGRLSPEKFALQLHTAIDTAIMISVAKPGHEGTEMVSTLFAFLKRHNIRCTRVCELPKRCSRKWKTLATKYAGADTIELIMKEDLIQDGLSEEQYTRLYFRDMVDLFGKLLTQGLIDPNGFSETSPRSTWTPILLALLPGETTMLQHLLDAGAMVPRYWFPNCLTYFGIHYMIEHNVLPTLTVTKLILQYGGEVPQGALIVMSNYLQSESADGDDGEVEIDDETLVAFYIVYQVYLKFPEPLIEESDRLEKAFQLLDKVVEQLHKDKNKALKADATDFLIQLYGSLDSKKLNRKRPKTAITLGHFVTENKQKNRSNES